MTFRFVRLDPVAHLDVIYPWVIEPRAQFWGMTNDSRDDVRSKYELVDSLDSHHAYLVHLQDRPIAILQTYQPEHDPVGEVYDVQTGDLGAHLFVTPTESLQPGFTGRLMEAILEFAFSDSAVQRMVGEPDVRNAKSVARVERHGAQRAGRVDLGHKEAQLFFLTREQWEATRATTARGNR